MSRVQCRLQAGPAGGLVSPMGAQYAKRAGFVCQFEVSDPAIGGTVCVWDATAAKRLPKAQFQGRWIVVHHDDQRMSPGGISFPTRQKAMTAARDLAAGVHEVKLRTLRTEVVPHVIPLEPVQTGSGAGTNAENHRAHDPSPTTAAVTQQHRPASLMNQDTRDIALAVALDTVEPDEIVSVLRDAMEANMTIWVDDGVDDAGKRIKKSVEIPDHKTRVAAATKMLEYKHGKPLERSEVIDRKVIDYSELESRMRSSVIYRNQLRAILDRMDSDDIA